MKDLFFVDYNQNIYDINGEIIGEIGKGYIVDRTRSDLIGEKSGKFVNIRSKDDIDKIRKIVVKDEVVNKVSELEVSGLKTVTKEENGQIKNYIVTNDGHIYDDNNSFLKFDEKLMRVFMDLLDDPIMSSKIAVMTPEELGEELIKATKWEYKEYNFDDANKLDKEDEKNRIISEKASEVDGRVNGELGIIENGAYDIREYSVVEEREVGYAVVNPTVVSNNLKTTEIVSSGNVSSDVVIEEEEVQNREMSEEKYYYLDADGNVYDNSGNLVEGIDSKYVIIDEDNNLLYQNQKIGIYGGTLDDLAQNIQSSREKGNVRVLKNDNSAGFGQIIVVSLVLLCLAMFGIIIVLSLFG